MTPSEHPGLPAVGPTLMLAATRPEASPIALALGVPMKAEHIYTPEWLLVQAGIGAQRTVAALNKSVRQKRVSRVIHFGYAGGLSTSLEPGHMPKFTTIAEPSGRLIAIDQPIPRVLLRDEPAPPGPRLISVPYLIHRTQDKQRLLKAHNAVAVDMESFATAQACAHLQLPYSCVRAISDPADMALPSGSEHWLDNQGFVRHARVIRFLLMHPKWISKVMALGNNSKVASAMLTREVIEQLHRPMPNIAAHETASHQPSRTLSVHPNEPAKAHADEHDDFIAAELD